MKQVSPPDNYIAKATLFDVSPDLFCIANVDGYFIDVNPRWSELLGWTREELLGRRFEEFVHPDDRSETTVEVATLASVDGHITQRFANRYRCKDGTFRWLSWSSRMFDDDGLIYAVARDETEQREMADQLEARETRLTFLVDELQRVRELERTQIAGEIHDFSLQDVIAAQFALDMATLSQDDLQTEVEQLRASATMCIDLLGKATTSLRRVLQGLSPLHMENQPLSVALAEQARATQRKWRVPVEIAVDPDIELDAELWIVAYRLVCEAMVNAAKHAHPSRIEVSVVRDSSWVRFRVADDGVGMDVLNPPQNEHGAGMGLSLMQRQIRSLRGIWDLRSAPGIGTTVTFSLPIVGG